ncbi:fra a 1-associated protein [Arachis stenosperma]|uniref:fra a 1-associated protein n=1 Tax=Arachis stenosperma TaxID=217475 RepID=UPI0025AB9C47|nr:fra a 1-associated protein [Arachis stenosperma]
MGWVWRDDDNGDNGNVDANSSSSVAVGEQCSTRRIVRSQCKTEEVEPGKFIKKCEKTEELFRDCVGKPVEVVQSNKEYTEEDVTDEVLRGGRFVSSDRGVSGVFDFPDIEHMERSIFGGIEDMERSIFGGLSRFFGAAEEMKNGLFDVFANTPGILDGESSSSSSYRRGIPIEEHNHGQEAHAKPKDKESTETDFAAMAKDV